METIIQNIDLYLGLFANVISTVGIPFAVWRLYTTWQKDKQMQQEIGVELFCPETDKIIPLPVKLKRAEFSRAELLGYLGMIVSSGTRYELEYTGKLDFFRELQRIQNATTPEIMRIPCTKNEIAQFKSDEEEAPAATSPAQATDEPETGDV